MNFNSIEFLVYLLVVIIVHRALPFKWRWAWLLIVSYYFYMSWNPTLVFLILGTTVVSYVAGIYIEKSQTQKVKKLLLTLTLVVCLGTLAFFKYWNFLFSSVVDFLNLFSLNLEGKVWDIILPVGISFYTFQTLSYVIDVYRGKVKAEKHFGYYALFVSYFPQLVAGPIERPDHLLPQLKAEKNATTEDMEQGLRLMIYGMFKKIAVADVVGAFVTSAFGNISANTGFSLWLAAMLFTIQIYCDFSGYSDIAAGCARMMGVKLTKNFNQPLLATSIREYGSRWHVSLNSWFMEYVYWPLGGSRKGKVRKYINIFIVFTLSGLWHGASWTFVMWGALIGTYTVVEDLLRPHYRNLCKRFNIDNKNALIVFIRRAIVFLLVGLTSVFFRAQSVEDVFLILAKMFTEFGLSEAYVNTSLTALSMSLLDIIQIALSLVIVALAHDMAYPSEKGNKLFSPLASGKTVEATRNTSYFYFIALIAVVWIIAASGNDTSAFLYFQF
ncbi:MAG: MBOAT family protein [Clostridiales bacterium]|nr:MBOAT family protein [Clostridiales bacterium]